MPRPISKPNPHYPFAHEASTESRALRDAQSIELSHDIVLWSQQTRILKKEPFSFKDRDYLLQIYRDIAKRILVAKGRQTELTELAVNWLLFLTWLFPGTIGLYVAARGSQTSKFSNLRVRDWAISQSPALQKIAPLQNHTATVLTLANSSKLYFHSAWEGYEEARSIPADFIVADEIQSQDVNEIDVLLSAMDHSPHQRFLGIGTGSDAETAWHKMWMKGTQFHWDEQSHSWIAKNPQAEDHSYNVPQTIVPWISKEQIDAKRKTMTLRRLITEIFGSWYKGAKKPITEAMMKACFDNNLSMLTPEEVDHSLGEVYFGNDWGGGERAFTVPYFWQCTNPSIPTFRVIYTEKIDEPDVAKQAERVIRLIDLYKPKKGVMDAGGGTYQVQQLEKRYRHYITKMIYLSNAAEPWKLDHIWDKNLVEVDRTFAIDSQISLITNKHITWPGADMDKIEFVIDHFTAIESKQAHSRKGDYTTYIHDISEPDDALHAQNGAWAAWYLDMRATKYKGIFKVGGPGGK